MRASAFKIFMTFLGAATLSSCRSAFFTSELTPTAVHVPFMKNSSNECYYLDDFMPTPDSVTTGRNGHLALRYYSYKMANYKDWKNSHINLSFYSNDSRCWSLFEEFYTVQ